MPQIVKKRRSGWAILAAGALVASLLAVGASPAAAIDEDSKPDQPATATACLGGALGDGGFTDISGASADAQAAINCLAYYGITTGTTADTFGPNSNVTRSQMALFLSRTAGVMGVDLSEGDMGADFGDIADVGDERQSAIAALARNGILAGRSDMAFDPHSDITRAEMAVALVNLADQTPGAPVHKNKKGLFVLGDDAATASLPDDSFSDAYADVSEPVNNAISAAYELGITTGTGDGTTFNPSGTVPRRNMAQFITRTMGHSNARPAGLTAQVAGGTITVSVRDADLAPVVNQAVDAFKTAVAFESKAFKDDGTCSSRTSFVDGATKCEVDGADPVTDSGGNSNLAQLDAVAIGKGLTVWLWAGDVGDKFGNSTEYFEMSLVPDDTSTPDATSSALSNSVARGATKVHFSETVTVTIQLKGDPDTTEPDNDLVDVGAGDIGGEDGVSYSVVVNKRATSDGTDPDSSDTVFDTKTISVTVGDGGAATFEIDADDTSADTTGNRVMVSYEVMGGDFSSDTPAGPDLQPDPNTGSVIFSDETAVVTAVTVDAAPFQNAPGVGSRAGSAATVTVVDQFARPFKGAGIVMTSDNDDSVLPSRARITGSNGQVRIGYSYTGGASDEALTATYPGPDGDIEAASDNVPGTTTAYWVSTSVEPSQAAATVLSADLDDNQVIVDETGGEVLPMSVNYDSGDYFTVDEEPASYDAFEEALGKGVAARAEALAAGDTPGPLTLAWSSYVYDDPSDIAQFTLVTK